MFSSTIDELRSHPAKKEITALTMVARDYEPSIDSALEIVRIIEYKLFRVRAPAVLTPRPRVYARKRVCVALAVAPVCQRLAQWFVRCHDGSRTLLLLDVCCAVPRCSALPSTSCPSCTC